MRRLFESVRFVFHQSRRALLMIVAPSTALELARIVRGVKALTTQDDAGALLMPLCVSW